MTEQGKPEPWMLDADDEIRRDLTAQLRQCKIRWKSDGRWVLIIAKHYAASQPLVPQPRKLDGKFSILGGQIVNTVSGEPIPEDEPLFLLRGRDHHALEAIQAYRSICAPDCNELHMDGISQTANKFTEFRLDHPERMKQPGITRHLKLEPLVPQQEPTKLTEAELQHCREVAATIPIVDHPRTYPEAAHELFDKLVTLKYNDHNRWRVQVDLADNTRAVIAVTNGSDGELARVQIRGIALQLLGHYLAGVPSEQGTPPQGTKKRFEQYFRREWPDCELHWTDADSNWCYCVHTIIDPQPFWEAFQAGASSPGYGIGFSAEERLPEVGSRVLAWWRERWEVVEYSQKSEEHLKFTRRDGQWWHSGHRITHWWALPTPPSGEKT